MIFTDWLILVTPLIVSLIGWHISSHGVWNNNLDRPRWMQMYLGAVMFVLGGFAFLGLLIVFIVYMVSS